MKHGSLLAALRGKDGRSLARALILFVLVNLFADGLDAGAAAATGDLVFCSVDVRDGGGQPVAPHHEPDCCLAGATPLGMGVAAKPPHVVPPVLEPPAVLQPEPGGGPPSAWAARATARGPPLDA